MFSKKLKAIRQKHNLTQKEFAKRLNVSPSTISMYERGDRMPNSAILKKISVLTDVPMEFFLDRQDRDHDVMSLIKSTCDLITTSDSLTYKNIPLTTNKTKKLTDSILLISELVLSEHIETTLRR